MDANALARRFKRRNRSCAPDEFRPARKQQAGCIAGDVIERGQLQLERIQGRFDLRFNAFRIPRKIFAVIGSGANAGKSAELERARCNSAVRRPSRAAASSVACAPARSSGVSRRLSRRLGTCEVPGAGLPATLASHSESSSRNHCQPSP